ncbi:MAG TPA: hypothetical protein VGN72_07415 [Tepidisphaeraceae bacterium]|jgi:hypothetical protein|nr:hypothetical protein [Tepidisphaeraceae bacterium]
MAENTPTTPPPTVDVGEQLRYYMGDTGGMNGVAGGYRIKVYHTRAFPWDEVFKVLLYRDFKVYVTRHKADIYIEAQP